MNFGIYFSKLYCPFIGVVNHASSSVTFLVGDEALVEPGSLLFRRTAEIQIGIIGIIMIHNLFVDSLHGSEFLSLIVGRTVLSMYHLLGNIKGEASYNVPVAISIVLDDILGESTFQKIADALAMIPYQD